MIKVEFQNTTGNGLTLLGFDTRVPNSQYYEKVIIEGKEYETEALYDFPEHIVIKGTGDFVGKEISFVA